ncbi:hypothetical protein CJ739_2194 [Mariniflexile rhizosphaerae]|uniref:hypothetical protein n=1 Tax=unclassified Mariniflexile TaxID=2643887 RepID=UPI000CA8A2E1|nr:hypothetical protein [Mariniflexile sp. TRM1-10]AXP81275.1 hypothetical protein CJ739_2194 [Mariniflexile sp. TRM1-10]PLB18111.1 MAG: hypothetical protein TRG1_3030 [Flavobacteriaceae bacterium FS1-H7996/R]
MIKIKYFLLTFAFLTLTNCNKTEEHEFPLDKRYWDINDYDKAILELRFGYMDDEKKPTFDNPEQRIIVQKLTDEQNFKIVLKDKELGLKHRNDVATEFFDHWKDMSQIYQATDRKDKYIYDIEMLAVWHYGLSLQLDYFKLGNDQIKESADDPNSSRVKNNINSNIETLISNYTIYLDKINDEDAFTEQGKIKLAEGIDKYFAQLIELYPEANYSGMKKKAELMLKKSESDKIKSSLVKLIELIDSNKKVE